MGSNKILIIEDDAFLSDLYKSELEALGFQVVQAADGLEGLTKISAENPSLILLDIVLPNYSGVEILQKIKSLENSQKIPVVLLTNVRDRKTIERCLELGAKTYFLKADTTPALLASEVRKMVTAESPATL